MWEGGHSYAIVGSCQWTCVNVCVIRQLVFTAAFLSISGSTGLSSNTVHRKKKEKKKQHLFYETA